MTDNDEMRKACERLYEQGFTDSAMEFAKILGYEAGQHGFTFAVGFYAAWNRRSAGSVPVVENPALIPAIMGLLKANAHWFDTLVHKGYEIPEKEFETIAHQVAILTTAKATAQAPVSGVDMALLKAVWDAAIEWEFDGEEHQLETSEERFKRKVIELTTAQGEVKHG